MHQCLGESKTELDEMKEYWAAFPGLRRELLQIMILLMSKWLYLKSGLRSNQI